MTVERMAELLPIRIGNGALAFRGALRLPILRSEACGLVAFGTLSGDAEVDDLSHIVSTVVRDLLVRAHCICDKYADKVT